MDVGALQVRARAERERRRRERHGATDRRIDLVYPAAPSTSSGPGIGGPYERYMAAGLAAGCTADQMNAFYIAGYVAQPKQLAFHAAARACDHPGGPVVVGYGGSRGQAKSHAILAQCIIDDAQRVPGLKGLFLRSVQKAAKESFEDLIRKVLGGVNHTYIPSRNMLTLPNGAYFLLGGFKDDRDIEKYLGIEYDLIAIEEATLLRDLRVNQLRGSLRTAKDGWRPRWYPSTNPGGIGLKWFKQMLVDPWRRGREETTRYIHTLRGDNIFINKEYDEYLGSLTGMLKRMWADADWDVNAGVYFEEFDYDRHVLPLRLPLPAHWRYSLSMDYGFQHWNVILLHGEDGDGVKYTISELNHRKHFPDEIAPEVGPWLGRYGLRLDDIAERRSGSDTFSQTGRSRSTVAEEYAGHGIHWQPAYTAPGSRREGAHELARRLGNKERGIPPTWFIFEDCRRLIETLPYLEADPNNPEDVKKVDCDPATGDGGDDWYDCARYGLFSPNASSMA
jgi:phage terminase large subunit